MNRTIVVPLTGPNLDPDGVAEQALPVAHALAKRTDDPVMLVSVIDVAAELDGQASSRPAEVARQISDRERYLAGIAETFAIGQASVVIRVGQPSDELLAVFSSLEDPIVVMASHGRSGVRRLVLGSIALEAVRKAQCPILVVPVETSADPSRVALLDRLIVPLDGSLMAECVLDHALDTLGRPDLDLHLVQVVEPMATWFGPPTGHYEDVSHELAVNYLEKMAEKLIIDGYRVTWEVRHGHPEQEIAAVVSERRINLIVMATHGRSGVGRLMFGSVAEGLALSAHVPLLLVRPSPEAIASIRESTRVGRRAMLPIDETVTDEAPLRVSDVMVSPVVTMRESDTIEDVARAMIEHRIGAMPIVDDRGLLSGIVTESDLTGDAASPLRAASGGGTLLGQSISRDEVEHIYTSGRTMTARQVMTTPVITAAEDEIVNRVVEMLIQHNINRVPVVRDGVPVGIVTRHDLLKVLAGATSRSRDRVGLHAP